MIRLGLRIGVVSGLRTSLPTLVTTFATALGALLMLLALSIGPGLQARADRVAWIETPFLVGVSPSTSSVTDVPRTFMSTTSDHLGAEAVTVVDLAGTAAGSPVPPGLRRLPAEGEVVLSPALADLVAAHPEADGRYGEVVGTVGDEALEGPDALVAVRGVSLHDGELVGQAVETFALTGEVRELKGMMGVLVLVGGVAMLAPVLLLVTIGTRLSIRSRETRLSALRLAGATRTQVTQLAAVEALVPGIVGTALGLVLLVLVRPAAAYVSYDSGRWFAQDLSPGLWGFVLVGIGVPLATVLATLTTLSRVQRAPLSTSRSSRSGHVRAWRVVPLVMALPVAHLLVTDADAGDLLGGGSDRATAAAFALLVLALLCAGPWLTQTAGAVMARSGSAALLLAGRRLTDEPRAAFRAVSSVVLAVLMTSLFIVTTPAAAETLASTEGSGQRTGTAVASIFYATPDASRTTHELLLGIPGISDPTLVYEGTLQTQTGAVRAWIGDCGSISQAAQLDDLPCDEAPLIATSAVADDLAEASAQGTAVVLDSVWAAQVSSLTHPSPGSINQVTVPAAPVAIMARLGGMDMPELIIDPLALGETLAALRPTLIVMRYDDDRALESARNTVLQHIPGSSIATRQSTYDGYSKDVRRLYHIVMIATITIFLIASFSLVVAALIGLVERRRAFTLMRAGGAPLRILRHVMLLEAAVPLAVMALLAGALGVLVGVWVAAADGGQSDLHWGALLLPVGAGLTVCLLMTATSLPFVGRITDSHTAGSE